MAESVDPPLDDVEEPEQPAKRLQVMRMLAFVIVPGFVHRLPGVRAVSDV